MVRIDGHRKNLGSRKRCLKCSPWGEHNTSHVGGARQGEKCTCEKCGREYVLTRSKGHNSKTCGSCQTKTRHYRIKARCVEYKGGQCEICGYTKCVAALEFHHRDERTKKFEVGGAYNRSWDVVRAELDKCLLLCGNCHQEHHYSGKSVEVLREEFLQSPRSSAAERLVYTEDAIGSNPVGGTRF